MQGVVFAIIPLAFDKLRDANGFTMTHRTGGGAKGGRGFPFSITGENDQNPFLFRGGCHADIHLFFQLLLTLAMTVAIGSRLHKRSLMSCRAGCTTMLLFKLAEEVVSFVVYQHEGRQVFNFHHPDRFHSQFGVFEAAQAFHVLLRQ